MVVVISPPFQDSSGLIIPAGDFSGRLAMISGSRGFRNIMLSNIRECMGKSCRSSYTKQKWLFWIQIC